MAAGNRLPWRGAMFDISRHFFDKDFIKKNMKALALFGYNTLHLHLTDDQGWRLESKVYPRLHEIGSYRVKSQNNHGLLEPTFDQSPHSGYLTQQDILEIIDQGKSLGINVVPEINIPGHTGALLAAYPEFGVNKKEVQVASEWGISRNLITPLPKTFEFLQNLFAEVAALFPFQYIHVGGDESLIDNWSKDREVIEYMKTIDVANNKELLNYFMKQVEGIINSLGKEMITWDDAFAFNPEGASNAIVMSWRGKEISQKALLHHRKVIQAPVFPTYFDYSQELSETEPLAIGGPITLEDVLGFEALDGVLGVQFQLWSEYIQNEEHAEYMIWPRAAALAFKAWSGESDFNEYFNSRRPALEELGIAIRELDPNLRKNIAHLGIGEYNPGISTADMVQALRNAAAKGEIAQDF